MSFENADSSSLYSTATHDQFSFQNIVNGLKILHSSRERLKILLCIKCVDLSFVLSWDILNRYIDLIYSVFC